MKKLLLFSIFLLAGCTSSKYYYHISSNENWRSYSSSCAGPLEEYERDLGSAARILLMPRQNENGTILHLRFLVKKGSAVQMVNTNVGVQIGPNAENIFLTIKEFTSGMEWEHIPKDRWVKTELFNANAKLEGVGRFANNDQPSMRDDWYDADFKLSKEKLNWFKVYIPGVMANSQLVKLEPVTFEYKKGNYVMCIQ